MFTIKHIDQRGQEFAVECVSYTVEPVDGEPGRIRVIGFSEPHMSSDTIGLWYGRRCHRNPGADEIHIMNRFGATIASHYFEQEGRQGAQVDGGTTFHAAAVAEAA